jgi:hypothetical protein
LLTLLLKVTEIFMSLQLIQIGCHHLAHVISFISVYHDY